MNKCWLEFETKLDMLDSWNKVEINQFLVKLNYPQYNFIILVFSEMM